MAAAFNDLVREKGRHEVDFTTVQATDLSMLLGKMYVELRQRNGEICGESSLFSFRAEVQRHLSEIGLTMHIIDPEFAPANKILRKLKR